MKRLILLALITVAAFGQPATKTWAGSTDWQEAAFTAVAVTGACDDTNTFPYSATGGNTDAPCRQRICIGRNDNGVVMALDWDGTWEDLGVPAGATVSTAQMTGLATKMHVWNAYCSSATLGPYALYNSTPTLEATLWSGRSPSAQEGSFTSEGSQSAQSVGTLTSSGATIKLRLSMTTSTGNNATAECSATFDDLGLSIAYTEGGSNHKRIIIVSWKTDADGKFWKKIWR